MADFERLAEGMKRIIDSDIILGPALASTGSGGLDDENYHLIRRQAEELVGMRSYVLPTHPDHPVSAFLVHNAVGETIASTAAYLSYIRLGHLHMDETMVMVARRLIEKMLKDVGHENMLSLMFMIQGYDDYQCLTHYGEVLESQFVSGELHRPWIHYTLKHELEYMLDTHIIHRHIKDGRNYVSLTDKGRDLYKERRVFLTETGFLTRRATLMRWSQFSELTQYDLVVNQMTSISQLRQQVLDKSEITPGMRVLELGCGTGELTLTAGLYKQVGMNGEIIATDPSFGMLTRAREKLANMKLENVRFVQAAAEAIPFSDNTFDAVVGCSFLHFTDIPRALREIHRVAKSGAPFTTHYGLNFPDGKNFFYDWFSPLILLNDGQTQSRFLPNEETVKNIIDDLSYKDVWIESVPIRTNFNDPENAVRFIVQVTNSFSCEMGKLPWKAQNEMIDQLITRGYEIREKYGADNMVQLHPGQLLKARVVK